MAALTSGQLTFRDTFASLTGFDKSFVGAWLLAEQSSDAAKGYEKRGYHNWLNIGNTDSLVARGGSFKSDVCGDPKKAAIASYQWMRGEGPVAKSYGKPAPGITAILSTRGKGKEAQIKALSKSGWASSGYEGGNTLRKLLTLGGLGSSNGGGILSIPGDIAGAVGGAVGDVVGGVAGAAGDVAGSAIDGVTGPLGTIASAFESIGRLFVNLFDPKWWLRMGKILIGIILVFIAIRKLAS